MLVTGPTGSGKSTSLASLVDIINQTKPLHIVTGKTQSNLSTATSAQ